MRFAIRVKPNARRTVVGGTWGDDGALVVAVAAPAIDGKANAAVLRALAAALGVPRRSIVVVGGAHNRSKVVEVMHPPPGLAATLASLRNAAR
jgi:uncharacterized protein (TIGR00251 family)